MPPQPLPPESVEREIRRRIRSNGGNVSLAKRSLGDAGVGALLACARGELGGWLTALNLSDNGVAAGGCAQLAAWLGGGGGALASLNLSGNAVGARGAEALAAMLRSNRTLATLNLGACSVGDEGGAALAAALSENATLRALNLRRAGLGAAAAAAFAAALAQTNSDGRPSCALAALNLAGNGLEEAGALAAITQSMLAIRDCAVGHEMRRQAALEGGACRLGGSRLMSADAGAGEADGATVARHVAAGVAGLTHLDLRKCSFGEPACRAIAEALEATPALTRVTLDEGQVTSLPAALVARIATTAALHELRRCCAVGEGGCYLNDRALGDHGSAAIARELRSPGCSGGVRDLALHYNSIGAGGAAELAEALKLSSCGVTELTLYSNPLGVEGVELVAAALCENASVTAIDLGSSGMADGGARCVAAMLRSNRSLTDLHLDYNGIGEGGGAEIAAALESNTTLLNMWLHGNEVGAAGSAISGALARNQGLAPRRLAAAHQRLALQAVLADAGLNLPAQCAAVLLEFAAADATERFEHQGWAWRRMQHSVRAICDVAAAEGSAVSGADVRDFLRLHRNKG